VLGSGTCCILLEAGSLGFIMVIQSLPIGVCGVSVCVFVVWSFMFEMFEPSSLSVELMFGLSCKLQAH
jgi:hypothetical protein